MTRATGKPCPCGSGLPGKRTLRLDCSSYIACAKCYVIEGGRTYKQSHDEDAKRQARARRAMEELREIREIERAGG